MNYQMLRATHQHRHAVAVLNRSAMRASDRALEHARV